MAELLEKGAEPLCRNDAIVKNMSEALRFVRYKPAFNGENLFALYSILSSNCLDEEDCLREGDIYRYDEVEMDRYYGCPHSCPRPSISERGIIASRCKTAGTAATI